MNERTKAHAYFVLNELLWNNCKGKRKTDNDDKAQAQFSRFQPSNSPEKRSMGICGDLTELNAISNRNGNHHGKVSMFDNFAHFIRILQVSE